MDKFGKSQPVKRVEDVRFLNGTGKYVDDITPKGALFGAFFRAPIAHGIITELNVDDARAAPGVRAVLTIDDLDAAGMTTAMAATLVDNRDGTKGAYTDRNMLARDLAPRR